MVSTFGAQPMPVAGFNSLIPNQPALSFQWQPPRQVLQHGELGSGTAEEEPARTLKTNILGCPCVMLASPEAARFVLVTQAHLFKPTYSKSKERLIGPCALFFHQGDYHLRLRKLVQNSMSLESLRNLVPHIETLAVSAMNSWGDGLVFNTFNEMKRFSFEVGILTIFGHLEPRLKRRFILLQQTSLIIYGRHL